MGKKRMFPVIISTVTFLIIVGFSLYKYVRYDQLDGGGVFFSFLCLAYIFNSLTWGDLDGVTEKDELEQHISTQSAKISYYVLMVLSAAVLFLSEGTGKLNDIENYPLLFVVGLTLVVHPITAFIYSRKYT